MQMASKITQNFFDCESEPRSQLFYEARDRHRQICDFYSNRLATSKMERHLFGSDKSREARIPDTIGITISTQNNLFIIEMRIMDYLPDGVRVIEDKLLVHLKRKINTEEFYQEDEVRRTFVLPKGFDIFGVRSFHRANKQLLLIEVPFKRSSGLIEIPVVDLNSINTRDLENKYACIFDTFMNLNRNLKADLGDLNFSEKDYIEPSEVEVNDFQSSEKTDVVDTTKMEASDVQSSKGANDIETNEEEANDTQSSEKADDIDTTVIEIEANRNHIQISEKTDDINTNKVEANDIQSSEEVDDIETTEVEANDIQSSEEVDDIETTEVEANDIQSSEKADIETTEVEKNYIQSSEESDDIEIIEMDANDIQSSEEIDIEIIEINDIKSYEETRKCTECIEVETFETKSSEVEAKIIDGIEISGENADLNDGFEICEKDVHCPSVPDYSEQTKNLSGKCEIVNISSNFDQDSDTFEVNDESTSPEKKSCFLS